MAAIFTIIPIVIIISAIIVRIATVKLKLTGLDEITARFQALSAFTGTGFTTRDSELLIHHDKRRKIIMRLKILGNAGIVSVIATMIISFMKGGTMSLAIKMVFL